MTVEEIISDIGKAFIILFDTGIVARIIIIAINGQSEEDQDTGGMIKRHVKAAIIANCIFAFIGIVKTYYS